MNIILFVAALIVAAASAFYWHRERKDKEKAELYKAVFVIAVAVFVVSGTTFLPETFYEKYQACIFAAVLVFLLVVLMQNIKKACYRFLGRNKK